MTTAPETASDRPQVSGLAQAAATARETALRTGEAVKSTAVAVGGAAAEAAASVARTARTVGTGVLDQNADGKVDQDDVKILTEKSKELAAKGAKELGSVAKEASKSDMVKNAAAGAIVGGAIASVVPIIGTVTGAAVGAAVGLARSLTRR